MGDMVDDLRDIKPRRFQTVYQECQKSYTSRGITTPSINLRAFLVMVVAPSKRPVTLRY